MATYPLAPLRQVAGYGVLSVRSMPLSVLAEGTVYSSVTFSPSVHSPTVHHPSDLFPSRVGKMTNPDVKATYSPQSNKKQPTLMKSPLSSSSSSSSSLDDDASSSYFHFASLHHHPSASLFSLQSYRALSTYTHSTQTPLSTQNKLSPLSPRFLSTSTQNEKEEVGKELMDLASRVVIASDPFQKISLLSQGHTICQNSSQNPSLLSTKTPKNFENFGFCGYQAPGRPEKPELVHPTKMLTHKKLKVPLHVYLLHSLAHIELNAIDIACDIVARFAPGLPIEFACDWFEVAYEEGVHFGLLCERLKALDYSYGDLPGHDGLWRAAENTKEDLVGRLVAIPLVQEARALDSKERLKGKMVSCADPKSAALVAKICDEEIKHVKFGVKWLEYIAEQRECPPKPSTKRELKNTLEKLSLPSMLREEQRRECLKNGINLFLHKNNYCYKMKTKIFFFFSFFFFFFIDHLIYFREEKNKTS